MQKFLTVLIITLLIISGCGKNETTYSHKWSEEKANEWYKETGWLRGCNFNPSTAINQLEMWQQETFDTETIDRELGWAADLGFNSMRVYLHNLVWEADADGLKNRINKFLGIAARHNISTMFVLLDDC